MASTARLLVRLVVENASAVEVLRREDLAEIADVVGENGEVDTVTLSNGFTALSPPTGVQAVVIRFVSGAFTTTLEGVTGDTGITLSSAALAICPVVLPLSAPSIGLTSTGAGVVEVIWL